MNSIKNKKEIYSGMVWIVSAISLVIYGILGLMNQSIPGVEKLVTYMSSVDGVFIYITAFLAILIEGLYVIGSFFPGSSLIVILAVLSQINGIFTFIMTIVAIFFGWVVAGVINIFIAKVWRVQILKNIDNPNYEVKDRPWITWFPAFRSNYEVSQIMEGGNAYKIFISSVRVKFIISLVMLVVTFTLPFFININKVSNEEGFVSLIVVAVISLIVGIVKIKKSLLSTDKENLIERNNFV